MEMGYTRAKSQWERSGGEGPEKECWTAVAVTCCSRRERSAGSEDQGAFEVGSRTETNTGKQRSKPGQETENTITTRNGRLPRSVQLVDQRDQYMRQRHRPRCREQKKMDENTTGDSRCSWLVDEWQAAGPGPSSKRALSFHHQDQPSTYGPVGPVFRYSFCRPRTRT